MTQGQAYSLIVPPPVGGLNTKDSYFGMPLTDAIQMENWFPEEQRVSIRKGYRSHGTDMGTGAVQGLYSFNLASGSSVLVACANNKLYDATSAGAATDITGASGAITSNWWQATHFKNRLIMVNGADAPRDLAYSGSWTVTATAWTGPTIANLIQVTGYKGRLYFVEKQNTKLWYGAVDTIAGALTSYNVESLLQLGGSVQFATPITRGVNNSDQELLLVASTAGEILVFQGEYPGSTTWGLVARMYAAPTIGRRGYFYLGGMLHLITTEGVISVADLLTNQNEGGYTTVSDKIDPTLVSEAASYASTSGWCGINYPAGRYCLINVPTSATASRQYVMNTKTKAWAKFTNQNAFHWAVFNNGLYFGGLNGKVFRADYYQTTSYDEDPTTGAASQQTCALVQAFNPLGDARITKNAVNLRLTIAQDTPVTWTADVDTDFNLRTSASSNTIVDARTPYSYRVEQAILSVNATGKYFAVRHDFSSSYPTDLYATEIFYKPGGIL